VRVALKFIPTGLADAWVIELDRMEDQRGYFARSFCSDEFAAQGLRSTFVQCNVSYNARRGTLRGMHFQAPPHEEAKLVRCTRGAVYDVIIDIRLKSNTYMRWAAFDLTADNSRMLYVPEGFAHGFQTQADGSELFYQMAQRYVPDAARGIRWNDPAFGIRWPLPDPVVSARDAAYADYVAE